MADDSDFKSSRGSWFGQFKGDHTWRDPGDNGQNKSGLSQSTPGIALPRSDTLGHYYEIVAPNNRRMVVRQVDQGPGKNTHRGIDINAPAAEMAGYTPGNFPTNDSWQYRYIGEKLPSGMNEGIQVGASQVAKTATTPIAAPNIIDLPAEQKYWGSRFGRFGEGGVKGLTVHDTGGHNDTLQSTLNTFRQRGYPAQFVMDRDGKVYRVLPEGARGAHMLNSWGEHPGLGNKNMEGIEVVGADSYRDFSPAQMAAMDQFAADRAEKNKYDPRKSIFGHEELNPGHKEKLEGMQWVESFRKRYDAGQWKPGTTQVATGPKWGTDEYWNQNKVAQVAHQGTPGTTTTPGQGATRPQETAQGGYGAYAPQVAAKAPATPPQAPAQVARAEHHEAEPERRPRSEPPQVADAHPKGGAQEHRRGPKHSEAARLAQGHADQSVGSGDARSTLPHGAGGYQPTGDGTGRSVAASTTPASSAGEYPIAPAAYDSAGGVPSEIVIRVVLS